MTAAKICHTTRQLTRSPLFSGHTFGVLVCFVLTAAPAPAQQCGRKHGTLLTRNGPQATLAHSLAVESA